MKRLGVFLAIIVGIAAILGVAKIAGRNGSDSAISAPIITVHRTTFETKLPENGVVQVPRAVTVPVLVAGNIAHIFAHPGDRVSAGELLATMDNATLEANAQSSQADYDSAMANVRTAKINEQNARVTYEASVQTAKSNLDEALRVYRADQALYASKAIPANQVDADKTKLEQAQVQYDQAVRQLQLGAVSGYGQDSVQYARSAAQKAQIVNASNQQQLAFTRIVAPIDGILESIASQPNDPMTSLRPGDPVTQGQMLFTIAPNDRYVVKAQVDEQDVINVHVGQGAIVSGEDFPNRQLKGYVSFISPVAIKSTDPSSTAKEVLTTITLYTSPPYLKDGMTVNVDILTSQVHNALAIPTDAILQDQGKSYVFTVRGGLAKRTRVSTGKANDSQTIITSGLAPGNQIVSRKQPGLTDGVHVTASPSPAASRT